METHKLITDAQIDAVWGNANFGNTPKRDVIKDSILKCAAGYHTGHTAKCIVEELGLVTKKWSLTKKGKDYLYEAFKIER